MEVLETIGKGRNAFAKNNIPGKLSREIFKQQLSRATKLVRWHYSQIYDNVDTEIMGPFVLGPLETGSFVSWVFLWLASFVLGPTSTDMVTVLRLNPKKNMVYGTHAAVDYNLPLYPLQSRLHKVFTRTYIEYRAVSGFFRTIDPPPPLHPASVSSSSPALKGGGGVHTRRAVRGQYFGRRQILDWTLTV